MSESEQKKVEKEGEEVKHTVSVSKEEEEEKTGEPVTSAAGIEAAEEAKLRSKYPMGRGHSALLQRRLAKGQKYFDSGDYQMAKQKPVTVNKSRMPPLLAHPTGEAIPTPESVPVRKTSIIQHSKLTTAS